MSRRTVLVTGASSGIGRATALRLAESGSDLVLVARSPEVLAEVAAECEGLGGRAVVAVADVLDEEAVVAAFDRGEAELGPIDGVVHAAAVLAFGRFEDVPTPVFNRIVQVNVLGTANLARQVLARAHESRTTTMVVVGSALGRLTAPYLSGYTASKWAVHALVRALRIETRRSPHVRFGLVTPGGVDTPIYDHCGSYAGRHGRPPPPVQSPERVADVVVDSLDHPRRNAAVGPGTTLGSLGFRLAPALFDRVIVPFMQRGALTRARVPDSPGNVFGPASGTHAVRGEWGRSHGRHHIPAPTEGASSMDKNESSTVTVERDVAAPTEAVWKVLSDGWSYATWVVGASRVRDVDPGWPDVGTQIHHSVGLWPALINDSTEVLRSEPPRELVLKARAWPTGAAEVAITIEPKGPAACRVTITEDAIEGPAKLIPKPARQLMIHPRNVEALLRLALLAEGRHQDPVSDV